MNYYIILSSSLIGLEYLIRLCTCYSQTFEELGGQCLRFRALNPIANKYLIFLLNPFNVIDIFVIIGLVLNTIKSSEHIKGVNFVNLLVLLRLFKLASYTRGFWIFVYVLSDSAIYLFYVTIFLGIILVVLGGLVYYAEMYFEKFKYYFDFNFRNKK